MKKIISILLAFGLFSGVAYAEFTNPPDSTIVSEKKGANGRRQGEQAAVIMLVRNSQSAQGITGNIASEDAVVYDTNSDDGVSVRTTTTSADGAFAGIAVTAILSSDAVTGTSAFDDYGRRNWGYILVHGKCTAKATAGGTNGNSAGDIVITSTDRGAITTMATVSSTVSAATNEVGKLIRGKGGFFYDGGDGTSTSYEVQVEKE